MKSNIVGPDGKPVPHTVTIEPEQALVVVGMQLDASINMLMATFRIPPQTIAENLMKTISRLVSPGEPDQARQAVIENLITQLRRDVTQQVGQRRMQQAVATQVVGGVKH